MLSSQVSLRQQDKAWVSTLTIDDLDAVERRTAVLLYGQQGVDSWGAVDLEPYVRSVVLGVVLHGKKYVEDFCDGFAAESACRQSSSVSFEAPNEMTEIHPSRLETAAKVFLRASELLGGAGQDWLRKENIYVSLMLCLPEPNFAHRPELTEGEISRPVASTLNRHPDLKTGRYKL